MRASSKDLHSLGAVQNELAEMFGEKGNRDIGLITRYIN